MNFWKNHFMLRMAVIAALFVSGLALTIIGWVMTGSLAGLGLMLVGVVLLLTALFVYNSIYKDKKCN